MTRQDVFDYVKKKYKPEPDYPWFDDNAVLRHADNNKWLTARLDGSAPGNEITSLIDLSYELTASKMKRKRQADE